VVAPPPEPPFVGPVDIAAGAEHTCAAHAGRVRCWGSNAFHQLGDPSLTHGRGVFREARREVPGLTRVVALGAGTHHTCAIRDSGEALCWGHGGYGQLGDGGRDDRPAPARVPLEGTVRSISGGDGHTCAAVAGGAVYCWGRNDHGQLGDGSFTPRPTPVRVPLPEDAVEVAAGRLHTCARGESGWVSCWGMHLFGQLGARVRVTGGHRATPEAIARLDDAIGLGAGMDHTCALRRSGRVMCWGRNEHSQLRLDRLRGLPANTSLVLGEGHSCALVPDARLMCVGVNRRQQIGPGGPLVGVPRRVREGEGSARVAVGYRHTCWVNTAGQIGCRGEPEGGRLGSEGTPAAQPPTQPEPHPERQPESAPAP
jgi:alpha-tubulin suppressor-like RCC1 family protein